MKTPRLVLLTATLTLLSATAQAEVCRLSDGREFSTNHMGDITYPTELVGFRLRERDDLQGYEIVRMWTTKYEVMLVESCRPGDSDFGGDGPGIDVIHKKVRAGQRGDRGGRGGRGGGRGPRDDSDGGRDSGGNCEPTDDDSPCAPR